MTSQHAPITIDIADLAARNTDAAGELMMALMPPEIVTRCRFSEKGTQQKIREITDPHADLTPEDTRIIARLTPMMKGLPDDEDVIEHDPYILHLAHGIYVAYLCDHDSDVIILIPHHRTQMEPKDRHSKITYTMLRNTDAKKEYGWTSETLTI